MNVPMLQSVASYVGRVFTPWRQAPENTASGEDQSLRGRAGLRNISANIRGLSLSARFAFAAAIVLCNGMALLGGWVATEIEDGLLMNTAVAESVYIRSLLAPTLPLLATSKSAPQIDDAVDSHLHATPLWDRLTSIAIWLPDGTIIYSTDKSLTGRKFKMQRQIRDAFKGETRTALSDKRMQLLSPKGPDEGTIRTVYTPLREKEGGKVMAVVEIVTNADALKTQLDSIRKRTWVVVGLSTLLMIAVLFGIVQNGSQTIEEQRLEIEQRLESEIRLGQINKELSERLQEANQRGIELGEEQFRRISSNLENGPAQLLALALLRMYELKRAADRSEDGLSHSMDDVVDVITLATKGALKELREIGSGLLLPQLQRISSYDAVERAIRSHEYTTSTAVERELSSLPQQLPLPIMICIFRVVQEGLMNAYSHAGGRGQTVMGSYEDGRVIITVSDDGPGFSTEELSKPGSNLGLRWLRQRVESIGGTLTIRSEEGVGTQLSAQFPYAMPPSDIRPAV